MKEDSHYYSDSIKKINRNTLVLFGGEVVSKVLTLIVVILIARYLGAEGYGAFSFVTILAIVSDFGFH